MKLLFLSRLKWPAGYFNNGYARVL